MRHTIIFLILTLFMLSNTECSKDVSFSKHWREILIVNDLNSSLGYTPRDHCPKSTPSNTSKKIDKSLDRINSSNKAITPPEKAIESFDEWTKKRRDAAANQVNGQQIIKGNADGISVGKVESTVTAPIASPTRNFASKECGAKVIASNPEAENAKSIVNEKDVDDYMRNPCESAKEKFVVIELCEAIQVKKFSIGNFELFASRPKQISVEISERYPPLANWVSLGTFQLQDHHKILQSFDVPNTNVYAKFVRINLENHYGKEHYCIVSVVNVMGTTLSDEYEKEEAAVHLMNTISSEKDNLNVMIETITTPAPSEETMQTQLPTPPKTKNVSLHSKKINRILKSCYKCSIQQKQSHLLCHILPVRLNITQFPVITPVAKILLKSKTVRKSQTVPNRTNRVSYDQSRRRNLANIQRLFTTFPMTPVDYHPTEKVENKSSNHSSAELPVQNEKEIIRTQKVEPEKPKPKIDLVEKANVEVEKDFIKNSKAPDPVLTSPKHEPILPAGGSTSQREMVLMKLSKRIAAVELNLTLSTEYLRELSKQYVSQMSGYQQELKETRRVSRDLSKAVESMLRSKVNGIRRDLRELRQSVRMLQQHENSRFQQSQYEMTRSIFVPACHMTASVLPQTVLPRLPQVIPNENGDSKIHFEDKWKRILEKAQSVVFGSFSWNTDHLIIALIVSNSIAVSLLLATVYYIHRRNRERCDETQSDMRDEMRRKVAKVINFNKKMISKGLRKAELAVTAAVTSNLNVKKNDKHRKAVGELELALANLFSIHQSRIDKQFEENQSLLKSVLEREDRCNNFNDTMSVEDSESSSETEHQKEDTPTS